MAGWRRAEVGGRLLNEVDKIQLAPVRADSAQYSRGPRPHWPARPGPCSPSAFDKTAMKAIATIPRARGPRSSTSTRLACAESPAQPDEHRTASQDTLFDAWRFDAFLAIADPTVLDTVATDKTRRHHDHRAGPHGPEGLGAGAPALSVLTASDPPTLLPALAVPLRDRGHRVEHPEPEVRHRTMPVSSADHDLAVT